MSAKKKEFKYIEAIKEIPKSIRERASEYDDLLKEFMNSGLDTAKIKLDVFKKDAKTVLSGLSKKISAKGYRIGLSIREKELYLKRLTEEEYKKKIEKAKIISERLKGRKRKTA